MNLNVFDKFGINIQIVTAGMCIVTLILLILLIAALAKIHGLKKKYNKFMSGKDAESLEEALKDKYDDMSQLQNDVKEIEKYLKNVNFRLNNAYQKVGIVKYDAFKEIGGKLSFCIALLTANDDGIILNSMHSSNEGCYTYAKEIANGESFVVLSSEEQEALDKAINYEISNNTSDDKK